jgi:hypothetical protein
MTNPASAILLLFPEFRHEFWVGLAASSFVFIELHIDLLFVG